MRWFPFASMLLAGACATASSPPEAPSGPSLADYVPLEVGNSWTYAVKFPGQSGERTVRIVEQDEEGYFAFDAGGKLRVSDDGLRDAQRYLVRTPLDAGRTWKAVVSVGAVEHYRIESVGEACSARAGRFDDCLVVRSSLRRDENVTLEVEFVWARDVGLVKISTAANIAGKGKVPQTEQSLVAYRVGRGEVEAPPTEAPSAPPSAPSAPSGDDAAPSGDDEAPAWGR